MRLSFVLSSLCFFSLVNSAFAKPDSPLTSKITLNSDVYPQNLARVYQGPYGACLIETLGDNAGGSVKCWGSPLSGGLPLPVSNTPVTVPSSAGLLSGFNSVQELSFGVFSGSYALLSSGTLLKWNENAIPANHTLLTVGTDYKQISAGHSHACGLSLNGEIRCWGKNFYGQLGVGDYVNSDTPRVVAGGPYISVSTGMYHTCALTQTRLVACWGADNYSGYGGVLGTDNSFPAGSCLDSNGLQMCNRPVPINTSQLPPSQLPKSIYSGGYSNALITENGKVYVWGDNRAGAIGQEREVHSRKRATLLAEIWEPIKHLSLGSFAGLAISRDNNLYSWGSNVFRQLGFDTRALPTCGVDFNVTNYFAGMTHLQADMTNFNFTSVTLRYDGDSYVVGFPKVSPEAASSTLDQASSINRSVIFASGAGSGGQLGNGTLGGPGRCNDSPNPADEPISSRYVKVQY